MSEFNEWFDSEYSNYGDSYKKLYDEKHDLYGSEFVNDRYEAFQAGAQSQQAKIGILQIKLNGADERAAAVLNHKNKMIDELQAKIDEINEVANGWKDEYRVMSLRYERSKKRIDELQARINKVMKYVSESPLKDVSRRAMINFMDILKGNKDEN